MHIPAVIAHGGAGPGPKRKTNLDIAVKEASTILKSGGSAIDAVVEACVILENDPDLNNYREVIKEYSSKDFLLITITSKSKIVINKNIILLLRLQFS